MGSMLRLFVCISVIIVAFMRPGAVLGQCGELYGEGRSPHDYRDPKNAAFLRQTNQNHFNSNVENLRKGLSSSVGADLNFTLRAFPNHHRALFSLVRFYEKAKIERLPDMTYAIPCYFERAMEFQPEDPTVRLLYAKYLAARGEHAKAAAQLQEADRLDPGNPNVKYNLGLELFELKRYDEAGVLAKQAYDMGFPYPGLKNKLQGVGKWPPKEAN